MQSLGLLFVLNTLLYGSLCIVSLLSIIMDTRALSLLQSIIALIIVLPLSGINLTALIEKVFKQNFTPLEKLFVATLLTLIIPPLCLTLFYDTFNFIHPTVSFLLPLLSWFLAVIFHPFFLEKSEAESIPHSLPYTLGLAFLFYTGLIGDVVSSYYALPDLDPYYWLRLYQEVFSKNTLVPLDGYRPLFSSLSYIFHMSAGIDLYAYFKYLLPFFSLILLLPLTLIAKNFHRTSVQLLVFGLPLATPSFLLYTLTPIPQAILNIGITLFIISLIHAYQSQKNFFFLSAGILMLFLSLYHESASLFFLFWFVSYLFFHKTDVRNAYKRNPFFVSTLILLVCIQAFQLFASMFSFLSLWMGQVSYLLNNATLNLLYPYTYINIDSITVGWSSFSGVIKYYAFYASPVSIALLLIILLFYRSGFLPSSKKYLFSLRQETAVIASLSFFFFILAEILPRFFNIAMLPERAWGFLVVFFYALSLLGLVKFSEKIPCVSACGKILLLALVINASAALYINNLKQYLITTSQLTSAEWIKNTLPEKRVILTHNNESLLRTHAQSRILNSTDPDFYNDIRIFDTLAQKHQVTSLDIDTVYMDYQEKLIQSVQTLKNIDPKNDNTVVLKNVSDIKKLTDTFLKDVETISNTSPKAESLDTIYIYYAKTNPLNPYIHRPYNTESSRSLDQTLVFDQYPKRFLRLYSAPNDEVVIWQYTP